MSNPNEPVKDKEELSSEELEQVSGGVFQWPSPDTFEPIPVNDTGEPGIYADIAKNANAGGRVLVLPD